MSSKVPDDKKEIPEIIHDNQTNSHYLRKRFFGKGGFAKCYEIKDMQTEEVYAGKIVSKKMMVKSNQRDKMAMEISIHRALCHKHVVGFHSFFEDSQNIYIVLELCKMRSMMELHKRRSAITEPETRFYMNQILQGVQYLHRNMIIHRDLKLGNLFLNDELHVKIGDFGLATKIEYEGERKKTLCGTPNYIAPEILFKKGHSFAVDIWSIGCIMYTLLAGKPPFETPSLKETYKKIKSCDYRLPSHLHRAASAMIMEMLQADPELRPSVDKLLKHAFLSAGIMPLALPESCLTTAPRLDQLEGARRPLTIVNADPNTVSVVSNSPQKKGGVSQHQEYLTHLKILKSQLLSLLATKPDKKISRLSDEEASDPAAQPLVWVSKWVDYSDKYGFGYQMCDESVGVTFNDTTKLILLANGMTVHYINRMGQESYMSREEYPADLEKKMKLLTYFRRYMSEHLMKAGASIPVRESDCLSRVPYVYEWCRTTSAVIMQLTNGTLQINFSDHSKIILCPLMAAVTYIDVQKNFCTYRFTSIEENGCSPGLAANLRYAVDKLNYLMNKNGAQT